MMFKPVRFAFIVCATAVLALAAGPAFAHAKLLAEVPAAGETGNPAVKAASVTELRLTFSEGPNAAFSKVTVTDSMGMAIESAVTIDAKDDKVLVVTFAAALPQGEYTVDWTAVAGDGHKSSGTYKVSVAQ